MHRTNRRRSGQTPVIPESPCDMPVKRGYSPTAYAGARGRAPTGRHRRLEPCESAASLPLLKAVLWDMDGTIVDTEPYWIEAEHALVEAYGGTVVARAGHAAGRAVAGLLGRHPAAGRRGLEIREIIDTLTGQVISRVRRTCRGGPGPGNCWTNFQRRRPLRPCDHVRGTAGPRNRGQPARSPTSSSWSPGDTVTQGKPHPEAYLKAVDLLQQQDPELTIDHCVALEDSGRALPPPWHPAS